MALSDLQKLFVVSTATRMWQQDLLMNAYFQGSAVGANLREMILGQQPVKPLTNPFDEAITGRLRSDSAAIRRAGQNVQEASSMVGIKEKCRPQEILFVADAMTGQDAVTVAEKFNEILDITGVVLTKMDEMKRGSSPVSTKLAR